MPAICESCGDVQPQTWRDAQSCASCGAAARRVVRCAACTRWAAPDRFCQHCAAELVPETDYGVARLLVQAGVDGLTLAQRLRDLDAAQRATLLAQADKQMVAVATLVTAARFCERQLAIAGHADALEAELCASLPWRHDRVAAVVATPLDPAAVSATLEQLRNHAGHGAIRQLAALALLRAGAKSQDLLAAAHTALHEPSEPRRALEACLALSRAAVLHGLQVLPRTAAERFAQVAALTLPPAPPLELALARGLALALQHGASRGRALLAESPLREVLRRGVTDPDATLRLGCAALAGDDARLDAMLDGAEPHASAALQALAELRSPRLWQRLAAAAPSLQRALLQRLRAPLDAAAWRGVVAALPRLDAESSGTALRLLMASEFAACPPGDRAALATNLGSVNLTTDAALALVHWATTEAGADAPHASQDAAPFAAIAARALAKLEPERRFDHLRGSDAFLALAETPPALELVASWLDSPRCPEVVAALLSLQGRARRAATRDGEGDDTAARVLLAAWANLDHDGRERLAARLPELTWRDRGSSSAVPFQRAFWARLLAQAAERGQIWRATASWRPAMSALRDGDPRAAEIDGGDPARRFAEYSAFDLRGAPQLLRELFERHPDAPQLAGISDTVFARAMALVHDGEHRLGLWLAASFVAEVANRFCVAPHDTAWRRAALTLTAPCRALQDAAAVQPPRNPRDDVSGLHEQIDSELRSIGDVVVRESEAAARAFEQRQREQAEAAAAQRAADERRAAAERAAAAITAAHVRRHDARPLGDATSQPLDDELVLPGQRLGTLREYAALLRAMRGGQDFSALLAAAGLDIPSWSACAAAWGELLLQRPELALRLAHLLG